MITKLGFYAPKNNPVQAVSVGLSTDGKTFRKLKTGELKVTPDGWGTVSADGSAGRRVRIHLEFKNRTANLLDEVEIYGWPLK